MDDLQRRWPAPLQVAPTPKPIPPWVWWVGGCGGVVALVFAIWGGFRLWGTFQSTGKDQIVALHREMAAQDAGAIFAESDPAYRKDVGRAQSDEIFQVIHDRLGDPVSYSVDSVNMSATTQNGTMKDLVLTTKFTKGDATETLRYHQVNGEWLMLVYRCNSDLLKDVQLKSTRKTDDDQ